VDIAVALAVAGLLGAAAHRGGLCTVRAVAELVTTRRGHILWSFLKASLWTTSILAIAALAGFEAPLSARPLGWWAVAGGFLFGMGAALNGACALSTFARLGEGHVSMAFAPLGWIAGIAFFASDAQELHPAVQPVALPGWLALPALAWIGVEGGRLCRRLWRDRMGPVGAPFWPLSLAVLVVAAAYATLLLLGFRWSFTATALCTAGAASLAPCRAAGPLVLLSAAAFAGMLASAVLRGTFRMRRPGARSALRHFGAGVVMGTGASLVPGGNDGLILFGLPALSLHALLAWLGIVGGILLPLALMQRAGMRMPRIRCKADICRVLP
jgi:uncharacterized protein